MLGLGGPLDYAEPEFELPPPIEITGVLDKLQFSYSKQCSTWVQILPHTGYMNYSMSPLPVLPERHLPCHSSGRSKWRVVQKLFAFRKSITLFVNANGVPVVTLQCKSHEPAGWKWVSEWRDWRTPNQPGSPAPVPLASRCGHLAVVYGGGHQLGLTLTDPHLVLSSEIPWALLPFKFQAFKESQHSARSRAWKANCECGSIYLLYVFPTPSSFWDSLSRTATFVSILCG